MSPISGVNSGKPFLMALMLLQSACGNSSAPSATNTDAASPPAATAPAGAPTGGPVAEGLCKLLTQSEVAAVFPDAEAGVVTTIRVEGATACIWNTPTGRLALQSWPAQDSVADELKGAVYPSLDLSKPTDGLIRYETVTGVGDEALAAVARKDEARGIVSDTAILVSRRGDRILLFIGNDLAQRNHDQALAALQSLGHSAAARLH